MIFLSLIRRQTVATPQPNKPAASSQLKRSSISTCAFILTILLLLMADSLTISQVDMLVKSLEEKNF
jgi:hypothetical protein